MFLGLFGMLLGHFGPLDQDLYLWDDVYDLGMFDDLRPLFRHLRCAGNWFLDGCHFGMFFSL